MDLAAGADEFRLLSIRLRAAGETGLRRELSKAISDAAQPVAEEIDNAVHLAGYMPKRYAAVLARDLQVTTHKSTSLASPGVTILARAPTVTGGRKIRQRNDGRITHPLFGDKDRWFVQTDGMRPGFFDDPARQAAPGVRQAILSAMSDVADQVTGKA